MLSISSVVLPFLINYRALFGGENDFLICLRESFPQLKGRKLTRVEWCMIRRLMGKPRRYVSIFLVKYRNDFKGVKTRQPYFLLEKVHFI